MGLFDKKYCDVCGEKIGLLGNRKLEDANLCKNCAKKLSPWFTGRRHTTLEEIRQQLDYREKNKEAVANFNTTRTLGSYVKVLLDEDARKFMVTDIKTKLAEANPDVLDFSMVTGCDLSIDEHRSEITRKVGNETRSFNPPRYEYSYDFYCIIHVNHPYFDEMKFKLNDTSVHTGEARPGSAILQTTHGVFGSVQTSTLSGNPEYDNFVSLAGEIKEVLMGARQTARDESEAKKIPKTAVTCPHCGATTLPDQHGRCEFCGGSVMS